MARKLAIAIVAVAALWWLSGLFVSDEAKIRNLLLQGERAFNDAHRSGALAVFSERFSDVKSRIDYNRLGRVFAYVFLKEKHPQTGELRFQLKLPEDRMAIVVEGGDSSSAMAEFDLQLSRRRAERLELEWAARVTARLENEDSGWKVVSTDYETLSGALPRL